MLKRHVVRLSNEERQTCQEVVKKLKGTSQKVRRAQILLKTDADGPAWTDARIADALSCRVQTVENLGKRVVLDSFELALNGTKRQHSPTQPKLDGVGEAKLIAMRLGKPPAGFGRWTLQLLADELVALEVVDSICRETVRQTLKKNRMTKRNIEYWVIPPEQDAEFVACMEDYEYERNGTASIFMFAEPLSGFRQTTARKRRTKKDWATEVAGLLDSRYADCRKITIVLDNLNTHTKGAFYDVFEPAVARGYLKRIDFVFTPKHGSWLNVAECELSCMTSQCLTGRRIGELHKLQA
jgi:hypothetical protein